MEGPQQGTDNPSTRRSRNPQAGRMQCRDSPGFRQSKAQASSGLPTREEGVEQMFPFEIRQPATGVGHSESGLPSPAIDKLPNLQHNPPSGGRRCDRIAHQCRQQNPQLSRIGDNRQGRGPRSQPQVDPLVSRAIRQRRPHLVNRGDQVAGNRPGLRRTGEQHQVADHVANSQRLRANCLERQDPIGVGLASQQLLHIPRDCRHGIVDFVPGPGSQFRQGPEFPVREFIVHASHQFPLRREPVGNWPLPGVDLRQKGRGATRDLQRSQPGGFAPPGWSGSGSMLAFRESSGRGQVRHPVADTSRRPACRVRRASAGTHWPPPPSGRKSCLPRPSR